MQARSFFPASVAEVVWDKLKGELKQSLSPVSLSAVAKLLIFFPHRSITTEKSLPWNQWAVEALDLWRDISHNSYWDSMWMCFLARLAKHDTFVRPSRPGPLDFLQSFPGTAPVQHMWLTFPIKHAKMLAYRYLITTMNRRCSCHVGTTA